MEIAEQAERLKEMRRLYEVEIRTLQQIADHLGISRQAVYERLAKAGVCFRPKRPTKREIEREILVQLYINEDLTIAETAERLKMNAQKVADEIKRHKIIKKFRFSSRQKYMELTLLEVGEKVVIQRPATKKPHLNLYIKASRIGIRISIKSLSKETLQVSRIA